MILVDKDIKQQVRSGNLILKGYQENHVNSISYDLTIENIVLSEKEEKDCYDLKPGGIVFIKTQEQIAIPMTVLGRISEKNSRMRQGLKVDGPTYQPGHVTYAFLRVQNLSTDTIKLSAGMRIAQIIFEELTKQPDIPYCDQKEAFFQFEESFHEFSSYEGKDN